MAPKPKYRLQPVLDQKEKAKKDAEQALAEAHRKLREEEEKKRALEQEKENVLRRIEEAKIKREPWPT
jgi:flagellar biosynthesis chaperone FliJ